MARGKAKDDGPHPVDRHVGRRVCEKRIALGYNQSDLGRAVGVTFQQIQKYEKGTNRISASKLFEIARFFQTEVSYFFQGLTDAQPGVAEEAAGFEHDFPATRQSVEIARLVPQLPPQKQKLALELVRSLHGKDD
jgi:transcriptional regulator with XRE-family HTH domain